MNCSERIDQAKNQTHDKRHPRCELLFVIVCFALMAGCGSTKMAVKAEPNLRPAVGNAFTGALSRAFSFNFESSTEKPKKKKDTQEVTEYPSLPWDEKTPGVRRFIREYAYNQRGSMKQYLARAETHLPIVKKIARQEGLPEDIAYLVMLESGANPEARSPANALGMWQFMPATARSYGLRVDSWVDERLDPAKSTKAAMVYLKDLYGMFGCWRLALSAYNSGENKLNRVLCEEDASEYDEICSSRKLARETREFFPRFQAIALIAKDPEKYGFAAINTDLQEDKNETVVIDGCYSLDSLAKAAAVSRDTLSDLNPSLIRGMTPQEGKNYELVLPSGTRSRFVAKLETLKEETSNRHLVHVVKRGDSLAKILKHYHVNKSQVANMNPDINLAKRLRQGDKILVPAIDSARKKTRRGPQLSQL